MGKIVDITTEHKKCREELQSQEKILNNKSEALKEVLNHIEAEKQKIKDDMIFNLDRIIMPIFDKFCLKGIEEKYLELLKKNLKEITSSFYRELTNAEIKLTHREMEVCNMIKNGYTNKEVAILLNIDIQTVEKHRQKIRKKLKIVRRGINLAAYLQNL